MSNEHKLLRQMTTAHGMEQIAKANLSPEVFEETICESAFQLGMTYWRDNGKHPTITVLTDQYPGLDLGQEPEEATSWLIDQLQNRHMVNHGQEIMRQAAKGLWEDPRAALAKAVDDIGQALGQAGTPTGNGAPKLWNASELAPAMQPRWLAKNRVPRGAVSLLVGDEGIGKSLLWVWLAAAVTTGKPLPEFGVPARDPAHVIVVVTEDDWSTTVLPRLQVAGADLSMVHVICTEKDGSGAPEFPRDLHLITQADPVPALIVVDAWLDTVPARLSVRDPQQARQALHPWKEVATTTDAAVLLLTHTNRVASANTRDRYGATGELRKKARMTLWAHKDEDGHLVVGPDKHNTTKGGAASMFAIASVGHFRATDDHDGTVPLLTYVGESDQTAQEHVAEAYAAGHRRTSAGEEAELWLKLFLGDGPRWATDVIEAGEKAGHNKDKLNRAKRHAGVESMKQKVTGGAWYWSLSEHKDREPETVEGNTFEVEDRN